MTQSPTAAPPSGGAAERPVVLAAVTGAHGVTGEVRLKLFAADADSLRAHGTVHAGGRTLRLTAVRPANQGAVARFAEIADRTAAEALRGQTLTVPRSALPPLGEGEYYHHDLIGLAAVTLDGALLGTVAQVLNFGAGDILEVTRPDGPALLIPFTTAAAPEWDDRRVLIDPAHLPE